MSPEVVEPKTRGGSTTIPLAYLSRSGILPEKSPSKPKYFDKNDIVENKRVGSIRGLTADFGRKSEALLLLALQGDINVNLTPAFLESLDFLLKYCEIFTAKTVKNRYSPEFTQFNNAINHDNGQDSITALFQLTNELDALLPSLITTKETRKTEPKSLADLFGELDKSEGSVEPAYFLNAVLMLAKIIRNHDLVRASIVTKNERVISSCFFFKQDEALLQFDGLIVPDNFMSSSQFRDVILYRVPFKLIEAKANFKMSRATGKNKLRAPTRYHQAVVQQQMAKLIDWADSINCLDLAYPPLPTEIVFFYNCGFSPYVVNSVKLDSHYFNAWYMGLNTKWYSYQQARSGRFGERFPELCFTDEDEADFVIFMERIGKIAENKLAQENKERELVKEKDLQLQTATQQKREETVARLKIVLPEDKLQQTEMF